MAAGYGKVACLLNILSDEPFKRITDPFTRFVKFLSTTIANYQALGGVCERADNLFGGTIQVDGKRKSTVMSIYIYAMILEHTY
jgi:hypothetical protein